MAVTLALLAEEQVQLVTPAISALQQLGKLASLETVI